MTIKKGKAKPKAEREPSPCDFCDDPHCLDDFITGECPIEEIQEECGCTYLFDNDAQIEVARIFTCRMHQEQDDYWSMLEKRESLKDGEK